MQVIVYATGSRKDEFLRKIKSSETFFFVDSFQELTKNDADAYFILSDDWEVHQLLQLPVKPVFINSVIDTLGVLNIPTHFCRMNGWDTFINRDSWEIAGDEKIVQPLFNDLGFEYLMVTDEPGFVAPRIISMIINEAYDAFGNNISTKEEIDIAMKLGTNYPYGPFEWASLIGESRIIALLFELQKSNAKYSVAPALEQESLKNCR